MVSLSEIQGLLSPVLTPLSRGYSALMSRRARRYAMGECEQFRPACPCLSVGNIGSGGSGKTPLADWLLKWADIQELSVVLLTRGYGAKPPHLPYVVGPHSPASESGDEPLMLARENPDARVVVDPVRKRSGAWASEEFSPDLVILDDGFQHMAVKRDMDFVLLTPDDLKDGWDRVIPRGTWREGKDALRRADVFFVKSGAESFKSMAGLVKDRLGPFGRPVFQFSLRAVGLKLLGGGDRLEFGSGKYVLFSGIGNPQMLVADAREYMGREPEKFIVFRDHHAYTDRDVEDIRRQAATLGAKRIICTPKDAVKLAGLGCDDFYVIDLEVEFLEALFFDGTAPLPFDKWWNLERLLNSSQQKEN
ncbi:tetraacyldisaccharide 4'-kinase [Maridesulfovibrio sp.]|uniref:tetraacyldisaccharide 4'-kinase n=1 Tax=Maridesulfovibrio sp. TaxID=2795000 RepID=UPI002A18CDFD|nr:tetraacyldisaccharide 4'-kinase [Maridesulfovibrio sp.]